MSDNRDCRMQCHQEKPKAGKICCRPLKCGLCPKMSFLQEPTKKCLNKEMSTWLGLVLWCVSDVDV